MGHLSQMIAEQKAIGDPGNDFNGVFGSMLGGGLGTSTRSTAELLAATTSSPWPHTATVLIAIREAETRWLLFRPGPKSNTREHKIHKDRINDPAMTVEGLKDRTALVADLKDTGFLVEQQQHPFLEMLRNGTMGFPDPMLQLSGFEVASLFSTTRQAVGESYFVLDRMGTPVPRRWLPVPPHWVMPPTHGERNFHITMSRLGAGGELSLSVPPEDIAAYRRPNPVDPYWRGKGSLHAVDHDVFTDDAASTHQGAMLQNSAVPRMLMIFSGLQPGERKEAEERWRSELTGPWKSGLTKFMSTPSGMKASEAFQLHELQKSPVELQISEMRSHQSDLILIASQVPPLTAGHHRSGNRAMALVAEKLMALNAVVPARTAVQNFFQARFFEPVGGRAPEYGPGWILTWSAPNQIDENSRDRLMANVPAHFSRRDFLEVGGQQAQPGDEFIYVIPNTMTLIDSRTNEPIFTPPPSANPGPFGAAASPGGTKLELLEHMVRELIDEVRDA